MSSHYYSQKPSTSGKKTVITTIQFGNHLSFKSQSGVFSWQKIDNGSQLLLKKLKLPEEENAQILDLGCGYGFLGISLAKANPEIIFHLTDINELAVKLTKENCKINQVEKNTVVYQGDLYEPLNNEFLFDSIITNPPLMAGKDILRKITSESKSHLKSTGSLQLVVPKKKGLISMQQMLTENFGSFEVLGKGSGYWILKANKA
ncbi:MAG: class I SAM-dependent methyltransferase [Candidatus Thorarchaeota archaeon]